MPTDFVSYWKELAAKAGLPEEQAIKVTEALQDESVSKVFGEKFKTISDYSRDLDAVRDRTRAETEGKYTDWYNQAMQVHQQNLAISDKYRKYQETYGELDDQNASGGNGRGDSLSRKEVEELLRNTLAERDKAVIGLQRQTAKVATSHVARFKEALDWDTVEKLAVERGVDLQTAYNEYIQPRIEAESRQEWEAKVKTAREEGAKEALSKVKIPIDTSPADPHMVFDAKVGKEYQDMTPAEREAQGRDAFYDEWSNWGRSHQ